MSGRRAIARCTPCAVQVRHPPCVALQYPGLRACVEADLATMLILADAGHRLFPATSWRWLFEELQK